MKKSTLLFSLLFLWSLNTLAQKKGKTQIQLPVTTTPAISSKSFDLSTMQWRNIGPFRGGRSLAVAGHASKPLTYYFGAVGGGVWKTTDGGINWICISDSTFTSSSVGDLAVAPSDANVIYAGMGEADMRSNISYGDGMYKSTDEGKTWKKIGLSKADAISTISIHPTNADIVYVAAVGNPFVPNKERGVFRTKDGGKSWEHILAVNDSTGAYHVEIDPSNPRIIYATTWQAYRNAHSMSSGGKGCGLYKSLDGGDTWLNLNQKPGMPKGLLGKIGITVSPANPNRLYALIENKNGGLFTSIDGGEHWKLVNNDKNLWQRPWYYMNLAADPKNELGVFVLNVNGFKSEDGGKTFRRLNVNHGDTHEIWVNPTNSDNFIIGDDGGGEITFNGGETFTEEDYPTAQFYHVTLDNDIPYNIYGAQQDNSSVRITSRSTGAGITDKDWYPVAGGEAGYIVSHPLNSKITFGGEYDGQLTTYNADNDETQDISPYPESNMGHTSAEKKYRFQWTYPIVFSPHNPNRMYITSQYVHVTEDNGHSWKIISPDLTRNDPKTTGATGGPITLDQTGAEIYATIFAFTEAENEKGTLWAGSDDGRLHVSKNNGESWENVSIPSTMLPDFALTSSIHASVFQKGKAYIASNRYMWGDRTPYLFKTTDYGKTWSKITAGIKEGDYCRVIREDPHVEGLLYAGTETGIYFSIDDGASWQSLQLNLPNTPIRDLQVQKREKDLVVATHGRSFWILDDLTPLYELVNNKQLVDKEAHLFTTRTTYRMKGGSFRRGNLAYGQNPDNGVVINYYLKDAKSNELKLQFLTEKSDTIITFSSTKQLNGKVKKASADFYEEEKEETGMITAKKGMNRFVWNMRYPAATEIKGDFSPIWSGNTAGPKVVPGNYKIRLIEGGKLLAETTAKIVKDPRIATSQADFEEQFSLAKKVYDKLDETHKAINKLKDMKKGIVDFMSTVQDSLILKELKPISAEITKKVEDTEQSLYQNKAKAFQDLLAYPIRLNDKLAGVKSVIESADTKPTKSSYEVFEDLSAKVNVLINTVKELESKDIRTFNEAIEKFKIPAVKVN